MARVVPIEVSSPEGFGTDRRVGTPHPSARLPVRAPTVVDINTYQLKTAKGFWSRFLLVVLVPLGLTLTWLTLPTQDSALLYFMARLALQGCVVGLVVVTFINHASPIKEVGHVPVSSQCAVVAGYGILAPVGTFIGVYWWGSLSPDAVYLGIIAAHLVMWPAATVGLPRTFVASEVDDSLHIVSDSSISYGGSDGEADATAQGRGPISVQNTASTAYDSADWAESVVPNLVVRAVTLRIGWALLILAFQLRFCITLAFWQDGSEPVDFVLLCLAYRVGVWAFKYLQRLSVGRHSGLFPSLEYASLTFAGFPYRVIVVSVGGWDVYFSILAFELVYKMVLYPLHLSTPVQRVKGILLGMWVDKLQRTLSVHAARLKRVAKNATPRAVRTLMESRSGGIPRRSTLSEHQEGLPDARWTINYADNTKSRSAPGKTQRSPAAKVPTLWSLDVEAANLAANLAANGQAPAKVMARVSPAGTPCTDTDRWSVSDTGAIGQRRARSNSHLSPAANDPSRYDSALPVEPAQTASSKRFARLTTRDVEEAGPHPAAYYAEVTVSPQNAVARVLLDEQGFQFSSAYDRKRLSTKFFFHGVVDITSVISVASVFLYLRCQEDSVVATIAADDLRVLYIRFGIAVVFDVIVIAAIALLSSCLLRDQNGFHPVVHGTKECVRIVKVMLVTGIAVGLISFTSLDFSRAPAFTGS